jgi:hypothetical protein
MTKNNINNNDNLPWQFRTDFHLLRDVRDWERRATNIPGVFLLKLPSSRTRQAAIAIEINPVDSAGSATKRRGIVVRYASELDE